MATIYDLPLREWILPELEWKGRYVYNWFSNFEPSERPILLSGLQFPAVEQAYQASKFSPDRRQAFTRMTPGQSKRAGQASGMRPDWDNVCVAAMDFLVRQKCAVGTADLERLALTEGDLIEANNWGDRRWGADLKGMGRNALGLIRMNIRQDWLETRSVPAGADEQDWAAHQEVLVDRLKQIEALCPRPGGPAQLKLF